jgi:hypothetical protein
LKLMATVIDSAIMRAMLLQADSGALLRLLQQVSAVLPPPPGVMGSSTCCTAWGCQPAVLPGGVNLLYCLGVSTCCTAWGCQPAVLPGGVNLLYCLHAAGRPVRGTMSIN